MKRNRFRKTALLAVVTCLCLLTSVFAPMSAAAAADPSVSGRSDFV